MNWLMSVPTRLSNSHARLRSSNSAPVASGWNVLIVKHVLLMYNQQLMHSLTCRLLHSQSLYLCCHSDD